MVLRPLPPLLFLPVALVVLVAGGAYCLGYEGLSGGIGQWPASLLWSAYGVLPWLFLFEGVKRRERSLGKALPPTESAAGRATRKRRSAFAPRLSGQSNNSSRKLFLRFL